MALSHPFIYTLGTWQFFLFNLEYENGKRTKRLFFACHRISRFGFQFYDELKARENALHLLQNTAKFSLSLLYSVFRSRPVWARIGRYPILIHCYLTSVAAGEKERKKCEAILFILSTLLVRSTHLSNSIMI